MPKNIIVFNQGIAVIFVEIKWTNVKELDIYFALLEFLQVFLGEDLVRKVPKAHALIVQR